MMSERKKSAKMRSLKTEGCKVVCGKEHRMFVEEVWKKKEKKRKVENY